MDKSTKDRRVKSFLDLDVYQRSYRAALVFIRKLSPLLKKIGQFDLNDQGRRCCRSIPALIAEGWAKRYQKKNFNKYITDAMGEANEMIVHISFVKDLDYPDRKLCNDLLNEYDIIGKQLYSLRQKWSSS